MSREHLPAAIIAVIFAALATTYALVTPLFEASDEISHYPVIHHIKTTGTLPVQQPGVFTRYEQEGSQPPLYYLIGAALTGWIDTSDIDEVRWRNPHGKIGLSHHDDNKNMVIHTEAEQWPWQGTALAVHLVRFFSVGLGTGSILLAWLLLREMWPGKPLVHIGGLVLMAFNPMFLFITGSVNNDNLTVFLATWQLLLVARVINDGLPVRRGLTIAVLFALGSLTKVSGLTLAPIIGVALLIHGWQRNGWRESFQTGFMMIAAWVVIAGWWYLRNIVLYGELTGIQTHIAVVGGRDITVWEVLTGEYLSFFTAYWAWFGGVNILADGWVYDLYAVLMVLSLVGLFAWIGVHMARREWSALMVPLVMGGYILLVIGSIVNWTTMTYGSQGRLAFPAIAAISGLAAGGLLLWLPERVRIGGVAAVAVPLLGIAVMSPFRYIAPTYAPPPTVAELPPDAVPVGSHWGPLELVGVRTEEAIRGEGGFMPVTAYWRLNAATETNYSTFYEVLGRDLAEIGKVNAFPGGGDLPTTQMEVGAIYEDRYRIPLDEEVTAPTIARVRIGVGVVEPGRFLVMLPRDAAGTVRDSIIVRAGVVYPRLMAECAPLPTEEAAATFFDFAALYAGGAVLTTDLSTDPALEMVIAPYAATATDLTLFLHVVDESGEVVAQNDREPLSGDYPTSLWHRRCPIAESLIVPVDQLSRTGTYRLLLGLYDRTTGERAPVIDSNGEPYPDFAVPVGTLTVTAPRTETP